MKIRKIMPGLLVIANLAALPVPAKAQSLLDSGDSSGTAATTTPAQLDLRIRVRRRQRRSATTSSTRSARIPSSAPRSRRGLAKPRIYLRSGGKAQRVMAGDSCPTSALQP